MSSVSKSQTTAQPIDRQPGAPSTSNSVRVRRVLLVSDHPSAHRGFATVGRHLAALLHASGVWDVHYVGRRPGDDPSGSYPYAIYTASVGDVNGERTFAAVAQRLSRRLPAGQCRLLILALGAVGEVAPLLRICSETGIRANIHFAAYVSVDYFPIPRVYGRFFRASDTIIPFTTLARQAISLCVGAGTRADLVAPAIPLGVDCSVFRPPSGSDRVAARGRYFGAAGHRLVIGFFGRNSHHKRADVALRVFRLFVQGLYVVCRRCSRLSAFELEPITYEYRRIDGCRHCGSDTVSPGRRRRTARLYMHAELLTGAELRASGGWDLQELARRMKLGDQVLFNPALRVGRGVPPTELAARMAACDVHLLPYEGGGWELTVLETGACGVPNVITAYGNPPEYAAVFSVPVRVRTYELRRRGEAVALIDEEEAVAALVRLSQSTRLRRRLGQAGARIAADCDWHRIGSRWLEVLSTIDLAAPAARHGLAALHPLISRTISGALGALE